MRVESEWQHRSDMGISGARGPASGTTPDFPSQGAPDPLHQRHVDSDATVAERQVSGVAVESDAKRAHTSGELLGARSKRPGRATGSGRGRLLTELRR